MSTRESDQNNHAIRSYLCLKCRKSGHKVEKCPFPQCHDEYGWFFSPERREMEFGRAAGTSARSLCQRCQQLDLLRFLRRDVPWKSRDDLEQATFHWSKFVRTLGQTGSIEFWDDCPLCCCLFALTPTPITTTQHVLMLPNWTMNRLEGGILMDTEEKGRYAKCLLIALHPSSYDLPFSDRAQRGDALCIVEEDDYRDYHDKAMTLGGRLIDPQYLRTEYIQEWLSSCDIRHPQSCKPIWTQQLEDIKLIDISTRKLISYPGSGCEYVALSYVWGDVKQQSFQLGTTVGQLPQTIEDTMKLVGMLKKQYLWVDSVCIDQANQADKDHQIKRMSMIYRGAYVTIIALSGESANSGLPRLGTTRRSQPQMTCCVDGTRLAGAMPTLSQQVWSSPWGSRGWTLQEGLLSPRCLYISDHQIYFECNSMQCSESLNETRSWVHQVYRNADSTQKSWSEAEIGGGVLRNPLVGLSGLKNNRLVQFGSGLALYSYRSLTYPKDALNAFSAILQYLEKDYTEGFFEGLPVADFQWGLLWRSQSPPRPREGFPTWSWAGWEGALWPGYPHNLHKPQQYQPYVQIWKVVGNQLVQLFNAPQETDEDTNTVDILLRIDPIDATAQSDSQSSQIELEEYPAAQHDRYIFVEAITLCFVPDYSKPLRNVRQRGKTEIFEFSVRGVVCRIEIMSMDLERDKVAGQIQEQESVVLARDYLDGWVIYHLLLLDLRDKIAKRVTTLSLLVPKDHLEVLQELRPRKKVVVIS